MSGELRCRREIGCHACGVAFLQEDFRMFRMALKQFKAELPAAKDRLHKHVESLIARIDVWIDPDEPEVKI